MTSQGILKPILSARGLSKTKGTREAGFTLKLEELELNPGEMVAFVGDSGCGKTTLLDILSLISTPDEADELTFNDHRNKQTFEFANLKAGSEDEIRADCRTRIGYVLQTGGMLPFLTVQKNAELPFRLMGQAVDSSRIKAVANDLGIGDKMELYPSSLSGGQRQRAAILRALAPRPPLLLADEPTAAVDWMRAQDIMKDLAALCRDDGVSVGLVTHDLRLVEQHVDRVFKFTLKTYGAHTVSTCFQAVKAPGKPKQSGKLEESA